MRPASPPPFAHRLSRARDDMRTAGVDAFVVTHLPNLRYLTGFSATAGAAILTPERCVLVVDARYVTVARELLSSRPDDGVDLKVVDQGYDEAIAAVLEGTGAARIGIEAASLSVSRFNWLSAQLASTPSASEGGSPALVPTERLIEARRVVKDASEITTLREAARRLSAMARAGLEFAREGRTELAVAGDIDMAIRAAGFERPAFETIVASGPNSARPHARPGGRRLQPGDGVVLDFGGVYDGYCVDLTRTVYIGVPAPALRRIAAAVREAHAAALSAVRPGVRPSRIDAAAREVLAGHGLGDAFGHATGHGLGLEVHEEPRIGKPARLPGVYPDTPVAPGMVFTIEPGAYVDGLGGVRIEDDVLVVDGGCEILTDVPIER